MVENRKNKVLGRMNLLGFLVLLLSLSVFFESSYAFSDHMDDINAYFFYSSTCPHCHNVLESGVLDNLAKVCSLKKILVSEDSKLFNEVNAELSKVAGYYPGAVPTLVIFKGDLNEALKEDKYLVLQGDKDIIDFAKNIDLKSFSEKFGKKDSGNVLKNKSRIVFDNTLFSLKNWLIIIFTGLSDSINPCIMSVLALLLAQLFLLKAKKRMKKVAFVFVLATFLSYLILGLLVLFGASVFVSKVTSNVSSIAGFVKVMIAVLLFLAGIVNIKDFFAYGKGFSFKLPEKYKSKVEKLAKRLTVGAVLTIALIVTLVEFPCSGIMYLGIISGMLFSKMSFFNSMVFLLVYNFIFVLPLIIISAFSIKSNDISKIEKFRMKYRGIFRLIMGIVLVVMAYYIFVI